MIAISNATPIIALAKINQLSIMKAIFSEIIVPQEVYKEITLKEELDEVKRIKASDFIKVQKVKNEYAVKLIKKLMGSLCSPDR
ncbi:hypothetical protein SAMN05660826_01934 [Caldanaerovirga acetigignens]|uniref:PIN domain-containing protein n=1 Tax=Caldanaerovirga acetigignens TaxID=447595 RepID=A0A1M7LIN5_9FIRM|nr:hypothetical protein [Caldanaerovirga acetigignens]SHM77902.1 hypothetical protein SAMN05660826_01934 [Caldanaerovirga acetigignens]